jgi:hypothetical protein
MRGPLSAGPRQPASLGRRRIVAAQLPPPMMRGFLPLGAKGRCTFRVGAGALATRGGPGRSNSKHMRRITSLLRWNRAWKVALVALPCAIALTLAVSATASGSVRAAEGPSAANAAQNLPTTTPTTTTPTTTTPTTTPTTPATTPAPATTSPYTPPAPYTAPTTTQAAPTPYTTPSVAPPVAPKPKPKPTFHFDPARVRMMLDFGAAARGPVPVVRVRARTAKDPSSSPNYARLLVLIVAGLAVLLGLVTLSVWLLRRRRLAIPQPPPVWAEPSRFPAGREFLRVYGDRMRVAFDERGMEVVIITLGLAAAVALGALVAG